MGPVINECGALLWSSMCQAVVPVTRNDSKDPLSPASEKARADDLRVCVAAIKLTCGGNPPVDVDHDVTHSAHQLAGPNT
jgi:hypothetical protein